MKAQIVLNERKKGFFSSKKIYQVGILAEFTEQEKSLFRMNPGIATMELLDEPRTQAGELLNGGVLIECLAASDQFIAQTKFTNGLKYLKNALTKAGADPAAFEMDYGPEATIDSIFRT